MADEPKKNDDLSGLVFMSGDQVAWAGPDAVLGQQQDDEDEGVEGNEDDGQVTIATGEDYTPPDTPGGE